MDARPDNVEELKPKAVSAAAKICQDCLAEIKAVLEKHGCVIVPFVVVSGKGIAESGYQVSLKG